MDARQKHWIIPSASASILCSTTSFMTSTKTAAMNGEFAEGNRLAKTLRTVDNTSFIDSDTVSKAMEHLEVTYRSDLFEGQMHIFVKHIEHLEPCHEDDSASCHVDRNRAVPGRLAKYLNDSKVMRRPELHAL